MERDSITVCVDFFSTLFIHLQAYWRLELKLKFIYLLAFVNAIFVHIANESERAL